MRIDAPLFAEIKGNFDFCPFDQSSQNFKRAMMARLPATVTFAAPSRREGGGPNGDSTHRGAAVPPVPRGSTHLKSGPD